jgi:hypothetical protein
VLNQRILLRETQPTPGGAGNLIALNRSSMGINDLGDYVVQVQTTVGGAIFRGTSLDSSPPIKFVQVGDPVPDPALSGFVMSRVGFIETATDVLSWAPVLMTNSGDIIWYGEWDNDPFNFGDNGGIFINNRLLVRKGTVQAGKNISEFGHRNCLQSCNRQLRRQIAVSPNGRHLIFEATTGSKPSCANNCPDAKESVFFMDLGESMPFGTVAQGCTHPYPGARLDHVSGAVVTGGGQTLGGLPLVGETFHVTVDSAPPGTTSVTLVFTDFAASGFPCGQSIPTCGATSTEFLLGAGQQGQMTQAGTTPMSFAIGPVPPSFLGAVSHAQAFFTGPCGTLGATNGLRFVFGSQ